MKLHTQTCIAIAVGQLVAAPVLAAIIPVNSSCTLVDAIRSANTDTSVNGCSIGSGADTIVLNANVTLATPFSGLDGLPAVTTTITVNGNNNTVLRQNGAADFRLLSVLGGELSINETTFSGGKLPSTDHGAGIYVNQYASLSLLNATLSGNSSAGSGAALYSKGTVTMSNSVITNNTAGSDGGGILLREGDDTYTGHLTLTDTDVTHNEAKDGGGIYAVGAGVSITINGGSISHNRAYRPTSESNYAFEGGGGIHTIRSQLTITDTLLSYNQAIFGFNQTGRFARGGALMLNRSENTQLTGVVMEKNLAQRGGGGYIARCNDSAIVDSTVSANTAQEHGGGIVANYNRGGGLTLDNVDVINNSAGGNGGGIYAPGDFLHVHSSTISGNSAVNGGGIAADKFVVRAANINLMDSTVSSNFASGDANAVRSGGGGIYIDESNLTLERTKILSNRSDAQGGGVMMRRFNTLQMTYSTVDGNSATSWGGGMFISTTTQPVIGYSTISHNISDSFGGGLHFRYSDRLVVYNSTISHNSATTGGGLYLRDSDTFTLRNATISANSASYLAGGVSFGTSRSGQLIGSIIAGNIAAYGNEISTNINDFYNYPSMSSSFNVFGTDNATFNQAFRRFVPEGGINNVLATTDNGAFSFLEVTPTPLAQIIEPLADNGGPTLTHALPLSSPAIKNASCLGFADFDQRGSRRPNINNLCDAGSFELVGDDEFCFVIKSLNNKVVALCL